MARHLAKEGKRQSGGAGPAAAVGAETREWCAPRQPAGACCCPGLMTAPGRLLALVCLLYGGDLGGWCPSFRSEACKKLKMAILGQGLGKAWEKGDFSLLRFPSRKLFPSKRDLLLWV